MDRSRIDRGLGAIAKSNAWLVRTINEHTPACSFVSIAPAAKVLESKLPSGRARNKERTRRDLALTYNTRPLPNIPNRVD